MIGRWLLLGLLGLGGCFAPDAASSTDDGESTDAASTTAGTSTEGSTESSTEASTEPSTDTSTDPNTSAEEESTGGGCPDAVFDRTAWDESCFAD